MKTNPTVKPVSSFLFWLYNVGIQCFCLSWLTLEEWLSSFFSSFLLFFSSSFSLHCNTVALKKCPSTLHYFSQGKKIQIRHQSVKLCYTSILCCVSYHFEKQSNHVQGKKKMLALTYLEPCHLLSSME